MSKIHECQKTAIDTRQNDFPHAELLNHSLLFDDNEPGALPQLLRVNEHYRHNPWPSPFDRSTHVVRLGDARNLSGIPDNSVHLIVTSPPYWILKKYEQGDSQLGDIADYEAFLTELDRVWSECARVLVPGGRVCCVVGDVCVSRRRAGRHYVLPLSADVRVRARAVGFDNLQGV